MGNLSSKTFEDGLGNLETLVEKLEGGDLSLEEALGAFEEGIKLVRYLEGKLTDVEKRVEVLTRDLDGSFALQALTEEEGT